MEEITASRVEVVCAKPQALYILDTNKISLCSQKTVLN